MVRIPTHRPPTHPGEMLQEEFLIPLGISQRELADSVGVSHQRINSVANASRAMTPSLALRLSRYFGTTADFWMNLQLRWDLYHAQQNEQHDLQRILPRAKVPDRSAART